jgi:hypothetical protein
MPTKPKEWIEEVARIVAASGSSWRVSAAWVEANGAMCCAPT